MDSTADEKSLLAFYGPGAHIRLPRSSMLTTADTLFEQFCTKKGIEYRRIPETNRKTPDYEIRLGQEEVVVEVKQLEPNSDDLHHLEQLRTGRTSARSVEMGRARQSIVETAKQLRAYAKGKFATIVVL